MEALFLKLVNMSLTASWLVLAVLLARLILRKAPRWIFAALWGLVAFRLICPISIESALSLIPSREPLPWEILYTAAPELQSGIGSIDGAVNPVLSGLLAPERGASVNPAQVWSFILSHVWLAGMAAMLLYAAGSVLLLRRRVAAATLLGENIKQSEQVDSPFVLGCLRPTIYLPYAMEASDMPHVIAHEQAHIKRHDHWWKPIGFLLLSVYWFNPILWLAYALLCRDIEAACDEKVIGDMERDERRAYSTALLNCGARRRRIAACPLAFGETGVKERVKSVMNYQKPAFRVIAAAAIVSALVAACFLTDPYDSQTVKSSDLIIESGGSADALDNSSMQDAERQIKISGVHFTYGAGQYDLSERNGSINAITGCFPIGEYLVLEGHTGPKHNVYCVFNTLTQTFEADITGANLTWYGDDIHTAVYSFWNDIFTYDGALLASLDLSGDEFIYALEYSADGAEIKVEIASDGDGGRGETIPLGTSAGPVIAYSDLDH